MKYGFTVGLGEMNKISLVVFWTGLVFILIAVSLILYQNRKQDQMFKKLEEMLKEAEKGCFQEKRWDESRVSRLEAQMALFLQRSVLSKKNLTAEESRLRKIISDISHQTRTPISNILLYAELLKESNLSEECGQMAEEIYWQGNKMKWMIESLMKLSRMEQEMIQVSPKQKKIKGLLEQSMRTCKRQAKEKDILLSLSCGEEEEAFFDYKWTGEAIGNVLDNAVKYTKPGGKIEVTAQSYALFERIDIKDTGIGIPEEEQEKIFGRFYRGEGVKEKEGVGIGLYLAREIIRKEGGYMKLASKPGKGSCFSVFLPKDEKRVEI